MQFSFFDKSKWLKKISKLGNTLEQLNSIVNWHIFTPVLEEAIPRTVSENSIGAPFWRSLRVPIPHARLNAADYLGF